MECLVIGDNHYNTLNVIRSLGKERIEVIALIITDEVDCFVLKSKYVSRGLTAKTPSVELIIDEFAKDKKIPVISTCDKIAAFLDENYNILSEKFYLASVGQKQGGIVKEMDKNIQLHHAAQAGFDTPNSIAVDLREINDVDYSSINFPCIIKPEESIEGSKNDFRICRNLEELKQSLENLSSKLNRVLIQDFIRNDEVILVAGARTTDRKNYVFGEVNKYKHSKHPSSLGLNCLGRYTADSELTECCKRYVDTIDYVGLYSFEVIRTHTDYTTKTCSSDKSLNYFLEMNLRADGLLYFYTKAGINYPALWVRSCYGDNIVLRASKKKVLGMNEFLYLHSYLSLESVLDFIRTDTFAFFSMKDPRPFFHILKKRFKGSK